MKAMNRSFKTSELHAISGPDGGTIGYVVRAHVGKGWLALDDNRKALKCVKTGISKFGAVDAVREDYERELTRQSKHPLPLVKRVKAVKSQPAPRPTYDYITKFESRSSPGVWHKVKRNHETGKLSCDCKGYIFSGKGGAERTCRHVREVAERKSNGKGKSV